jgi:transcriptional regulator with XRE-family HTH domain
MSKKQRDPRQRQETLATLLMPVYEGKLEENLGNRLRELRRQQGFSLRALAEISGLSANTLSLIENGKTSPSVATLQQIALALNIPITAFFEAGVSRDPVIFTQRDMRTPSPFSHGTLEELGSGIGNEGLQPFIVTFEARTDSGPTPLSHDGSEFVYCVSGEVVYTILGQDYTLKSGDSLVFSSKMPHTWHNPLEEPSQVVIVMAPVEENRHNIRLQYPV